MALKKELKNQPIVILAQNFNPSVFNYYWLVNNDFLKVDEVLPTSVFSPEFVQVNSTKFNLTVAPPQLQFASLISENAGIDIEKCLIPMLFKLQEVPYKAIGINFNWFVEDDTKTIAEVTKDLFYRDTLKIYSKFNTSDARYGIYLSKDYKGSRLKLDIKPITLVGPGSSINKEYIHLQFNFHADLSLENSYNQLLDCLKKWSEFKEASESITNLIMP